MLVLSRKANEVITIGPDSELDPDVTLRHAFLRGPIQIRLVHIGGGKVRIAIEAPRHLKIWRGYRPGPHGKTKEVADPNASTRDATEPSKSMT